MDKTFYTLSISGLNLHHVIEYFEREHFHAKNLSRTDKNTLFVTLPKSEYKKFRSENFARTFKIKIIKRSGNEETISSLLRHIGLFLGLIVAAASVVLCTNRIFAVELCEENHTCKNQQQCIFYGENRNKLLESLKDLGIAKGKSLPLKNSNREIEQKLIRQFKQISGVTIRQNGVKIVIEIKEATLREEEHISNLASPVSGVIVTSTINSGKSHVKNGDIVLKGQTLVSPENNKNVSASFEIRTFYHETMVYSDNITSYKKTGKKYTINNIEFFGLKLKSCKKQPFTIYEAKTTKRYMFYNLFFPFTSTSTTFEELKKEETVVPFEQVENTLKQKLYAETKANLPSNVEEKNKTFATFKEKDKTRLDCYIEAIVTVSAT